MTRQGTMNIMKICKNSFKDKIIIIKAFVKNKNNNSSIRKIKEKLMKDDYRERKNNSPQRKKNKSS